MLRKFNGGRSKLTWEVLPGDKTWIYRHEPETKMQSAVWLFPGTSSHPQKTQKNHSAHRRKWLPVSSENRAMSTPFLLRTDGQPLRTGTRITVSRRSSKFGASAIQRRDPRQGLFLHHNNAIAHTAATAVAFLMRARCSCCRTHRTRQTSLPATSSYSQK